MIIHQMDVDTAFLNATLQEEIYMIPPAGLTGIQPGQVLKLNKSLYGLKQSPRNFNMEINDTLLSLGFTRCTSDTCIYVKTVNGNDMYVAIYVDDIIIACKDEELIKEVKAEIASKYKVKDMGEMDWYLGMRYTRDPTTGIITLDQSKYAGDVLTRFKEWYKISPYYTTPMDENLKLHKWTEAYDATLSAKSKQYVKDYPYKQVVGSLLYLAIWTRPDITYAVHSVARHNAHPTLEAVHACSRILSYIYVTKSLGLTFYPGNRKLSTFVDSSFADIPGDNKSTGGMIQFLGYSPIYWETFVANTTIPLSTAESEYVAAHVAGKEVMSTNNLLTEMNHPQQTTPIYEDNQACITIALQEASKHKTKHILTKVHYIRDLVQKKIVDIIYISTHLQLADIFTKALGKTLFLKHRDVILGRPPSDELAMYLASVQELYHYNRTNDEIDNTVHFHANYKPRWMNGFT